MAAPPPPAPDMKVANVCADALDCSICYHALKAPIFMCSAGHVLCSTCRDRLKGAGTNKCPHCRAVMSGGFLRCHAMERVVEDARVACPNAAYGCDATPVYHTREDHLLACPHAPCHCPGGEACGFVGSAAALLDHIVSGAHNEWPCTAAPSHSVLLGFRFFRVDLSLRDGFNFVVTDGGEHGDKQLFLLNVTSHWRCRSVAVIGIRPRAAAAAKEISFEIRHGNVWFENQECQDIKLRVPWSDLSDGVPLPDANCGHHLVVPEYVLRDEHDDDMKVTVYISTNGTPSHAGR